MTHRINYIDRMKGMAILFVVIGHIFMFSMEQSSNVAAQVIYAFHMPLFMFLSGIVAAKGITPPFGALGNSFRKYWHCYCL